MVAAASGVAFPTAWSGVGVHHKLEKVHSEGCEPATPEPLLLLEPEVRSLGTEAEP